jgi:threonine synthase
MARQLGARDVCLPSAGNAASALAAYAARAGLKAHVFVPRDVPRVFLMEAQGLGAASETVDGLITDAGRVCAEQARKHGWYDCATLKEPYRVEGKKDPGLRARRTAGRQASGRDPVSDRRRHGSSPTSPVEESNF